MLFSLFACLLMVGVRIELGEVSSACALDDTAVCVIGRHVSPEVPRTLVRCFNCGDEIKKRTRTLCTHTNLVRQTRISRMSSYIIGLICKVCDNPGLRKI